MSTVHLNGWVHEFGLGWDLEDEKFGMKAEQTRTAVNVLVL